MNLDICEKCTGKKINWIVIRLGDGKVWFFDFIFSGGVHRCKQNIKCDNEWYFKDGQKEIFSRDDLPKAKAFFNKLDAEKMTIEHLVGCSKSDCFYKFEHQLNDWNNE